MFVCVAVLGVAVNSFCRKSFQSPVCVKGHWCAAVDVFVAAVVAAVVLAAAVARVVAGIVAAAAVLLLWLMMVLLSALLALLLEVVLLAFLRLLRFILLICKPADTPPDCVFSC